MYDEMREEFRTLKDLNMGFCLLVKILHGSTEKKLFLLVHYNLEIIEFCLLMNTFSYVQNYVNSGVYLDLGSIY